MAIVKMKGDRDKWQYGEYGVSGSALLLYCYIALYCLLPSDTQTGFILCHLWNIEHEIAILTYQIGPGLSHGHGQVQSQSGQGGQDGQGGHWSGW